MGRYSATWTKRAPIRRRGSNGIVLPFPAASEVMPFGHYLTQEWLPSVRTEIEPSTYLSVEREVRNYIIPKLGDIPVSEISRETLLNYYHEMLRTPMVKKSGLLSKSSVINLHSTISWSLQALLEANRIPFNPAWGIRPRMKKSERYQPQIWTPQNLLSFLDFVQSDEYFPLWSVLALTGVRRSEALGLQWGDFSTDWKFVGIRRAFCEAGPQTYVTVPKAVAGRRIDLFPETATALRRYRRKQQRRRTSHGARPLGPHDFVFTSFVDGVAELPRPYKVSRRFTALSREADLPRIRLHDLRHTHATHLMEAGANPKAVQERLGHADPVYTIETYVHLMLRFKLKL